MNPKPMDLWGLDIELEGHEGRLLAAPPVIQDPASRRVGVARDPSWSIEPERQVKWFISESDAEDAVTRLKLSERVHIAPGQTVAVLGPLFHRDCVAIEPNKLWREWVPIQDGFRICCLSTDEYTSLVHEWATLAERAFDRELQRGDPAEAIISPDVEAAARLLSGNAAVRLDNRFVRLLAAARLARQADKYRRLQLAAEVQLRMTAAELERLVVQYFDVLFPTWTRLPPVTDSPLVVTRSGARVTDSRYKPDIFGESSREAFFSKASSLNGQLKSLAVDFGSYCAGLVRREAWTEGDFEVMWRIFARPPIPPPARMFYPIAVRSYFQEVASLWQWEPFQWDARREQFSRVTAKLDTIQAICRKYSDLNQLILGEDPFPEPRSLHHLTYNLARQHGGLACNVYPLKYGSDNLEHGPPSRPSADVTVRNVLTAPSSQQDPPIFNHRGYYVFASRAHLTDLASSIDEVPKDIRDAAQIILDTSTLEPTPTRPQNVDVLPARCWIALNGGLPRPGDGEFSALYNDLAQCAASSGIPLEMRWYPKPSRNRFDDAFEQFASGKSNVYMGGSVHSRLITRWLAVPFEFIALLVPDDFEKLRRPKPFPIPNVLVVGPHLKSRLKTTDVTRLTRAMRELYQEEWHILAEAAQACVRPDSEAARFLRAMMAELLSGPQHATFFDRRWSFVTHLDDMTGIFLDDNVAEPMVGAQAGR